MDLGQDAADAQVWDSVTERLVQIALNLELQLKLLREQRLWL